jgi:hypothetical protein
MWIRSRTYTILYCKRFVRLQVTIKTHNRDQKIIFLYLINLIILFYLFIILFIKKMPPHKKKKKKILRPPLV